MHSLSHPDHRKFNVGGAFFDKGETWSGLGECLHEIALPAVERIKHVHAACLGRHELPNGTTLAQLALRWALVRADSLAYATHAQHCMPRRAGERWHAYGTRHSRPAVVLYRVSTRA